MVLYCINSKIALAIYQFSKATRAYMPYIPSFLMSHKQKIFLSPDSETNRWHSRCCEFIKLKGIYKK